MFLQVLFFTTCERKVLALMQRRLGPTVLGDRGRLQYLADALKILFKNYVGPRKIHSTFFQGSSISAFWLSWYSFSNLSFNYGEDINDLDFNIFFLICCSTCFGLAILISGWASVSKYALLGCVRAFSQLISYEIIMGSIFLVLFMVTGTSNFEIFIDQQISFSFFLFLPTIGIIAFLATLMETNRPPFDLSEAESDVVAGYTVEYAGILFGLFYLGEYVNIFTNAFTMNIVFFGGGWNLFSQLFFFIKAFIYYFFVYLDNFFIKNFTNLSIFNIHFSKFYCSVFIFILIVLIHGCYRYFREFTIYQDLFFFYCLLYSFIFYTRLIILKIYYYSFYVLLIFFSLFKYKN